ncbi:MAG: hypothetical protein Q9172_002070 [Xanthocarpia lactea]
MLTLTVVIVALGMCLIGALPWVRGVLLTISQLLGGIASAAVVSVLFPGPLNVRTSLLPGTSNAQGLFIEMFLSAQLVFTIFMLAAEKHKATFIAPVGIGLSLFIAELTAGFYKFIKMLEYETANPGQDFDDKEQDFFDPSKGTNRPIVNLVPDGSAYMEEENDRSDSGLPDVSSPGPEFKHPPPPESRGRQPQISAMKGGRAGSVVDQHDDYVNDEASRPELRYQRGPDAEMGKATPRDSGRV